MKVERVYMALIKKGLKTLSDVPERLRDKVIKLLGGDENENMY